jgi:hypothetical protein
MIVKRDVVYFREYFIGYFLFGIIPLYLWKHGL